MSGVLWQCPEHGTVFDGDGRECCNKAWPVDLSDPDAAVQQITCTLPRPRSRVGDRAKAVVVVGLWIAALAWFIAGLYFGWYSG
jgi:hypothetical protein